MKTLSDYLYESLNEEKNELVESTNENSLIESKENQEENKDNN